MGSYHLNAQNSEGQLRFTVSGSIDSTNAAEFGDLVAKERRKHPDGEVVFDCGGLDYISSTGLRVFLKLKKSEMEPVQLVNVSQSVNEVLEMTGFSQLFDVKAAETAPASHAMKDVSDAETQKIGTVGNITVYRVGEDTLLKVYDKGTSLATIEQERNYAQAAFVSGVPTLITYDVVTYQGQYAMLYELARANTISALLKPAPWKLDEYAQEMGYLMRTIHNSRPEAGSLPATSDIYRKWAWKMMPWLRPKEIETLVRVIQAIPEEPTVVYGNFHARNVFVQQSKVHANGELLLINLTGISCGNPVYDLGAAYIAHVMEPEKVAARITGLDAPQVRKFWNIMIRTYFGTDDDEVIEEKEEIIRAAALLRSALSPAASPMAKEHADRFVFQARRSLFPTANHLAALLSEARF
ncbi:MAG: anti-sigma factor antagonist [Synergistaceae bacterium]|nr:anti-sigma factor antagonist [Synergistaceae bacterium]